MKDYLSEPILVLNMVYRFHNDVPLMEWFKNRISSYLIEVITLVDILWMKFLIVAWTVSRASSCQVYWDVTSCNL